MEKAIQFWFHGFAEGLDSLEESQRQTLLAQCSKACLQRGDLPRYRSLYEQAEGDCNRFFEKLNELDGVDSEMMVPNASIVSASSGVPVPWSGRAICTRRICVNVPGRASWSCSGPSGRKKQ